MIRGMTINDYNEVFQLWTNSQGMGLNDRDDSMEGIARYLQRNPTTCFVAQQDDAIIGVILSGHDGRRGYIYHLAVIDSYQGRGIGSSLLQAALNALNKEGIIKVALVAFAANQSGNSFWEKRGFSARKDLVYRNKWINGPHGM